MANISNMTRQEFIQLLEKREKRRKKLRRKRRIITLILFSLAVCITNTVVAFAAEQDTPQTKITIKVAEPVKLVIKVANQDGNEETYDVVPTDDSSCVQEIVSDNVVLQTNFEEGEEQKKEDTATVSSQENDTSEPVSDEIQEIDDAQESSEITDSQDAVSIYEDTSQYKKYMNLSDTQKEYFSDAAEEFGVSEAMAIGICYNESRFAPTATNVNTNGTTDWRIAQCNDTTFSYLNSVLGISSMYDVLDMQTGIRACCALLVTAIPSTLSKISFMKRTLKTMPTTQAN